MLGSATPPLHKWSTQPQGLYHYYDKGVVTAFTRGCDWNGEECGPNFNSDWAIDQLFFNLVSCNGLCKQLYIETFDTVPTELEDWVPETGLIDTGNFSKWKKDDMSGALFWHPLHLCFENIFYGVLFLKKYVFRIFSFDSELEFNRRFI